MGVVLNIFLWVSQAIVALVFLPGVFMKLKSSPNAVKLFSVIGIEPWGRYLTAILELATIILIVIPKTIVIGAIISLIVILPAIALHLTKLGISVNKDKGIMFMMALVIFALSVFILIGRIYF